MTQALDPDLIYSVSHHEAPGGKPVLRAYRDTEDVWTIGFGTNLQTLVIDEALAWAWLRAILNASQEFARGQYTWFEDLKQPRKNAIVELIYQLGPHGFHGFAGMRNALAYQDYAHAAQELLDSKYHKVQMVNSPRDEWLAELIRTGIYTTKSAY